MWFAGALLLFNGLLIIAFHQYWLGAAAITALLAAPRLVERGATMSMKALPLLQVGVGVAVPFDQDQSARSALTPCWFENCAATAARLDVQICPITMKALFWSAVINGIVAVPLMVVAILLASRKSVTGVLVATKPVVVLGWITAGVMAIAAARMFVPI